MSDAEEEVLEGEENQAPVEHVVQEEEAEPVVETHDDEKEMLIFNKILAGAFDDSIPPTKRKLVRIFTSSTFTGNKKSCDLYAIKVCFKKFVSQILLLRGICSWRRFTRDLKPTAKNTTD